MSQTLFEKLRLKDEKNLLIQGLPSTIEKQFVKLSFAKNVTPLLKIRKIDFALVFALNQKQLNDILTEDKWMGDNAQRIKKIRKKLAGADWLQPKEEVKGMMDFYLESIEEIKVLILAASKGFTQIETEVHALRRKLRWLSIYPQALQGTIQLTDSGIADENIQAYLTPEIVNSAFNKMPDAGNNSYFLLLEKNYFLALSWMIAELGKLKDSGLKIIAVTEALQQTEGLQHDEAQQKAFHVLGTDSGALQKILSDATDISRKYFGEHNLDKLVHGIAKPVGDDR